MSERWTRGPWHTDGHGLRTIVRGDNGAIVCVRHRLDAEQHEANSHLIAAAPTLFEYVNKCAMNGCKEAEHIIKGVTSGS